MLRTPRRRIAKLSRDKYRLSGIVQAGTGEDRINWGARRDLGARPVRASSSRRALRESRR